MKVQKSIVLIFALAISISGCNNKNSNTSTDNISSESSSNIANESTNETSSNLPSNIITETVKEAELVPHQFYEFLNNQEYENAVNLLGPSLKFYGEPDMIKYLENIENTEFLEFKDISSYVDYLDYSQQNCYAVKVYYAELKMKVKDENLVPDLVNTQYRKMVVIKETENSAWLLDGDESTTPLNVD